MTTRFRVTLIGAAITAVVIAVGIVRRGQPAMSDQENIQGLWKKHVSLYRGKQLEGASTAYFLAEGNYWKTISPDFVDDGKRRSTVTFELDESATPKRFTETIQHYGPEDRPLPEPYISRCIYRFDGDTLTICSGGLPGEYPKDFSDEYSLLVLKRDHGPIPEPRKPSGTKPIEFEPVGTMDWSDNLNWYYREVDNELGRFELKVNVDDGGQVDASLKRAKTVFSRFQHYQELALSFAADELLELKNGEWRDESEPRLTAEEFKSKLDLESLSFDPDGRVEFWFNGGSLFNYHSVNVVIDSDDNLMFANI